MNQNNDPETQGFPQNFIQFEDVFDLILIFTKKQNWKHLLAYIFALIFVLPYVVLVIIKSKYSVTEYWPEDPTFIFIVYRSLCRNKRKCYLNDF